ncbi:MAG: hypothetical protein D6828_05660, partial [Nitrospirae bacterium]
MAFVYSKTSPVIYKKNEEEKQEALRRMMPQADKIYTEKGWVWFPHGKRAEYYKAERNGKTIGYIVRTFGKGYSGYID